jgi:hypothetical protein
MQKDTALLTGSVLGKLFQQLAAFGYATPNPTSAAWQANAVLDIMSSACRGSRDWESMCWCGATNRGDLSCART